MAHDSAPADSFRYDAYELDSALRRLTCRYSIGTRHFCERVSFEPGGDWDTPAVDAAARLVFLLAGVSYYKTSAPPIVDLAGLATTGRERRFLRTFYTEGLAEFAYRNGLDLSGLQFTGPELDQQSPVGFAPAAGRPLVPFGGGIDSIVSADEVSRKHPDASLFVVSKSGDRFDAIEEPARVTGLRVVRAEREVDPAVVRSTESGFLNGHVPVTGIISAIAVMAAVLGGHDAVVMSNEWSASIGTLVVDGHTINHQWSKGIDFERGFRELLAAGIGPVPDYFSLLRPYSELWVANRFASLTRFHGAFRSCNRAFHIERAKRLDHWCGTCDKCCFVDLILSPFISRDDLSEVFDGKEPLEDPSLGDRFGALVGSGTKGKPFECVGEEGECRAAVRLAAGRPDRAGTKLLHALAAELGGGSGGGGPAPAELLRPIGPHFVPDDYLPDDYLPDDQVSRPQQRH
jgi:hypothetical protein